MRIRKYMIDRQAFAFFLAVIGLLITITGNFFHVSIAKKGCYLGGTLLLLLPAIMEENFFFSILESILAVGAGIAFLPISFFWKSSIPVGLGVLAAIYFAVDGQLKDHLTWLSMFGVLLGTWGYAVTTPIIYFTAGAVVTTYSFCAFKRGEDIALVFGILNAVFTMTAFWEVVIRFH